MGKTSKFLDILLSLELRDYLKSYMFSAEKNKEGAEKVERTLMEIAWKHLKNDDWEMTNHIAQIIEVQPLKIMLEVGLDDVFTAMREEKIDAIIKSMGFSKDGLCRDTQQALIIGAAKTILNGYDFDRLKGFTYLVRSPQPFEQEVIDGIHKLPEGRSGPEWRSREFPKLIKFLKESVFTAK